MTPPTILCVSSYFKGNRFLQRARREGCRVYLLTVEGKLQEPWAREAAEEVFALPTFADRRAVVNGVAYLMRSRKVDRIVALDDYDVELAAHLREHFRKPGMGETNVRYFRDKLAMRVLARECDIPVPEFTATTHHDDVRDFLATVPGPWLVKPRSEASAMGIRKFTQADEVWRHLEALGDEQSFHLVERMVPCDLYHVDSLVVRSEVVFAQASRYLRPLLDVYQGGGIFASRTLRRRTPEARELEDLNHMILESFGLDRGASHTEFLRDRDTGEYYFLETSARVGGASVSDMVEAATGINLWEEWAAVEARGGEYTLPPSRQEHGGVVVSLARQEWPDTSSFTDPEVCYRVSIKNHVGLVVRSPSSERIDALLGDYIERIARDYHAVLPPSDKATG